MPRLHIDPTKRLLSVSEAAEVFGLSPYTLRQWVHQGKVPVIRIDTTVRIDRQDLEMLLQNAKQQWSPAPSLAANARKGHTKRHQQKEAVQ